MQRFPFSPINKRPPLALPKGAKVAVYLIVNIELWPIERAVARQYFGAPGGAAIVPDIPNWSWHEYGMRVGFWRLLEAIEKRGLKASAAINGSVIDSDYAPVAEAVLDAGWAFMGHGYNQVPLHIAGDETAEIARTFEALRAFSGVNPLGWLGPGLHETPDTLDHLAAAGFRFVVDWPLDDQPVRMTTKFGDMIALPYSVETGDLPMMVAHQHQSEVWLTRMRDQFDQLYAEGGEQARIMSMSVHPYIIGAPHRLKYFEQALDYILGHEDVWFAAPEELYRWSAENA